MRVIIVHNKHHVQAALEAAHTLRTPVILQSAPDAIFYAGGMYLLGMFGQTKENFPDVKAIFILDCADAGGEAIEAMRSGHTHIRSSAPPEIRQKLASIALNHGVKLMEEPYESLDLSATGDTKEACLKWLKGDPCQ